ncbi:MAG TPA: helix-turn-helix domain-containing protein [Nitrospiraceae bacterium]|nr:helix-turn-helix domain-containing protein [Nitrospiraceae bacterium]
MRRQTPSEAIGYTGHTLSLPALSPSASRFVSDHPDQAALAVRAALEAAAAQYESLRSADSEVPDSLRAFVVETAAAVARPNLISPEDAAKRLAVSRATVYNWIEARRLIGWRLTRQGTLIPEEQILGPGEVVVGIDRVLEVIPEPRAAWRFLSDESAFFDTPQRPIDCLKAGRIDEVVSAARSWGEAFT